MEHILRALSGWLIKHDAIEPDCYAAGDLSDCQRYDRDADGGTADCYSFYGYEKI